MHRQKNHPFLDLIRNLGTNPHFPPAPLNHHRIPFHDPSFNGILEMDFKKRKREMLVQFTDLPCPGHGVPLVPYSSCRKYQGKIRTDGFGFILWPGGQYLCLSIRRMKYSVGKKSFGSSFFRVNEGPLY